MKQKPFRKSLRSGEIGESYGHSLESGCELPKIMSNVTHLYWH